MRAFLVRDWFWIVGGDSTKAYSSAARGYVPVAAVGQDVSATPIANEVELYDVLARAGCASLAPGRMFSTTEVRATLLNIDASATGSASTASDLASVGAALGLVLPAMA